MAVQSTAALPLMAQLWPERADNRLVRAVALAVLGTLLLTLAAKIRVPFWPVEMTMQTCAVFLIGAAYGSRLAIATVLLYLAEGAAGLPVFTGTPERGLGIAYMMQATGGYLVGYVLAAGLVGLLAERGYLRTVPAAALGFLAADALVFVAGLSWLSGLIGVEGAIAGGLMPFLPGEALKIALATALVLLGQTAFQRR